MKQYDDSERHFTKAFPNAAVDIADAFTAIRAQNINADIRKRLDNLSAYGPPGIARFVVEVGAKDLDGAYATAWSEYNSTSQETHAAGSKRARADWWGQTAADFRSDPRFAELTQSVGLLDFWQKHGWPDLCQPLNETVVCR